LARLVDQDVVEDAGAQLAGGNGQGPGDPERSPSLEGESEVVGEMEVAMLRMIDEIGSQPVA
jgi:hypothetical protein